MNVKKKPQRNKSMKVPSAKISKEKFKVIEKPTPPIEHFYELTEFTNEIPTIVEIVNKIKAELQITSFSEVTSELSSVLEKISAKKVIFSNFLYLVKCYQTLPINVDDNTGDSAQFLLIVKNKNVNLTFL